MFFGCGKNVFGRMKKGLKRFDESSYAPDSPGVSSPGKIRIGLCNDRMRFE